MIVTIVFHMWDGGQKQVDIGKEGLYWLWFFFYIMGFLNGILADK